MNVINGKLMALSAMYIDSKKSKLSIILFAILLDFFLIL